MAWNYRLTRQRTAEEDAYAVREVYYDDQGQVSGWTQSPVGPWGGSVAEARADHARIGRAFELPVLDITDEDRPFEVDGDEPGPTGGDDART